MEEAPTRLPVSLKSYVLSGPGFPLGVWRLLGGGGGGGEEGGGRWGGGGGTHTTSW